MGETDKRLNEVIRIRKSPNNFVMMDKTFLEDDRLSFKAKGILAYLLSKPDNWKVIVWDLVNHSGDGKAAVYSGLKELKEYGYYKKVPIRNENGTRIERWESTIYENPSLSLSQKEQVAYPEKKEIQVKEEQKREENLKDSSISLLPTFQEIENQEIENQEIENRERNNNYYSNNKFSNIYSSQSSQDLSKQDRHDGQKELNDTLSRIKKQIEYDKLKQNHKEDIELIDEVVRIFLDALLSQSDTICIGQEKKPRELVRSNLGKVGYKHIEYILCKFKENKREIKKKQSYLLAMLYRTPMELNAYYTNQTKIDHSISEQQSIPVVTKKGKINKFNDFPQREYTPKEFEELERMLLLR